MCPRASPGSLWISTDAWEALLVPGPWEPFYPYYGTGHSEVQDKELAFFAANVQW